MENYIVKQIKIPEAEEEYPNLYGWNGAEEKSPAWKAKLESMHFRQEDKFDINNLPYYQDCYEVQAQCLDSVFRITNLWDEPDAVFTIQVGHSTSVGDIIVEKSTGDHYMVCNFGFKLLGVTEVQKVA
tara:strand:- start:48330 stop:48713 length:384 start_codon:yes stop_codon:yes gene_type:complete